MSDIQVGEYCRTAYGYIVKAKDYYKKLEIITINEWAGFISVSDITKHSFNIIDLIEEGDYVNGDFVIWINNYVIHTEEIDYYKEKINGDIKSIVTHEQFLESEYKLNE